MLIVMEEGYETGQDDETIKTLSLLFLIIVVTVFFGVFLEYDISSMIIWVSLELVAGICCHGIEREQQRSA